MLDWNAIAHDAVVERLAGLIRRRFGVWVGLMDAQGAAYPIGAHTTELHRPACACFKAHPLTSADEHREKTCALAIEAWANAPDATDTTCHVGMSAMVRALTDTQQVRVGTVYASGFFAEETQTQALIQARRALRRTGLSEERADPAMLDEVPCLDAAERAMLIDLLELLCHEVQLRVDDRLSDEARPEAGAVSFCGMIGKSAPMLQLFRMIERVAPTNSTVLILGENGTGKELVARALHTESRRRQRPFVVQNCAAIPGELIESELFGHKRGAFSGAHRDRQGLFEVANEGTFFLDEIGEMHLPLQSKMLRVLQEGTFLPVGDSTFRKVDVRMICATNRDLRAMVSEGSFREDLFYRINVITLRVPALRQRPTDIPLLAQYFLNRAVREHNRSRKEFHPEVIEHLTSYDWPGNVRELENEVERMVILSGDDELISPAALSGKIADAEGSPLAFATGEMELPEAVERLERQMILSALQETGWNKTQSAKQLGISRRNLIRKVARFGFED